VRVGWGPYLRITEASISKYRGKKKGLITFPPAQGLLVGPIQVILQTKKELQKKQISSSHPKGCDHAVGGREKKKNPQGGKNEGRLDHLAGKVAIGSGGGIKIGKT